MGNHRLGVPRLFIALPIADDVIAELARVARDGPRDWRWVKPDAMHLTLAFLGEVEEGRVAATERALRRGAEGAPALELAAAGLGAFPDQRRARVLWAGVAGDLRQLAALQTGIARALGSEGFELDGKPFHPHLTLARARVPQPLPPSLDRAQRFGSWRATEVRLYRSHLGPQGPRYEVLAAAALGGMETGPSAGL